MSSLPTSESVNSAPMYLKCGRTLRPTPKSKMNRLQEKLFIWLARTAENATTYFQIPHDRVVEIGTQIAI